MCIHVHDVHDMHTICVCLWTYHYPVLYVLTVCHSHFSDKFCEVSPLLKIHNGFYNWNVLMYMHCIYALLAYYQFITAQWTSNYILYKVRCGFLNSTCLSFKSEWQAGSIIIQSIIFYCRIILVLGLQHWRLFFIHQMPVK